MMHSLQPGTELLPPTLRALALGLLLETAVPLPAPARDKAALPPCAGQSDAEDMAELWQALRCKCGELSALVVRANDPEEAAVYLLGYLPRHIEDVLGRPGVAGELAGRWLANGRHAEEVRDLQPGAW